MTWRFVEIRAPAIVPISLKMGVMFGGLLPGYPTSGAGCAIPVAYRFPSPTMRAIKLIYTTSGFAATERQTVVRKLSKIWAKFGVAAPRPWGEGQNLTPRGQ